MAALNKATQFQNLNNLDMSTKESKTEQPCTLHSVMPRISHFIDENGNYVDLNAEGINVRLRQDGMHHYFRSFGFAGRKELTPVYGA